MQRVFWCLLYISLMSSLAFAEEAAPLTPTVLWANGAPGALGSAPEDTPTITIYRASSGQTGNARAAFVICPGGAYWNLAPYEGHDVALWLNARGITAAVLKYRLAPRYHHPAPLQDVTRAMRMLRARATDLNVDPQRIGVWGFSAGGHLAATIATQFDAGNAGAGDPVERVSSRPDLVVLAYPVISMKDGLTHAGSRHNLLGEHPSSALITALSNETRVTANTPPTFLFHNLDDGAVPVENSLLFAAALRAAKVPHELHVFEKGEHGVGLAQNNPSLREWPKLLENWLRLHGFVDEDPVPQKVLLLTKW